MCRNAATDGLSMKCITNMYCLSNNDGGPGSHIAALYLRGGVTGMCQIPLLWCEDLGNMPGGIIVLA